MKKKVVAVILSALIALCVGFTMAGCNTYDGNFFDKEHLLEHGIPDLPKPQYALGKDSGEEIAVFIPGVEKIRAYAKEVYDYLISCNFPVLGTQGESASSLIGQKYKVKLTNDFNDYEIHIACSDGDEIISYIFVWAYEKYPDLKSWNLHYLKIQLWQSQTGIALQLCNRLDPYQLSVEETENTEQHD